MSNTYTTSTILTAAISVKRRQSRQNTPLSKPAILKFTIAKIEQSWKKREKFNIGLSLNQSFKVKVRFKFNTKTTKFTLR